MITPLILASLLTGTAADPAANEGVAPAPESGLWVGTIRVCSKTVQSVEMIIAPVVDGPVLALAFEPPAAQRLARETSALVGRRLSVRLDGRSVVELVVHEPILGGRLELRGPTAAELSDMYEAARRDC